MQTWDYSNHNQATLLRILQLPLTAGGQLLTPHPSLYLFSSAVLLSTFHLLHPSAVGTNRIQSTKCSVPVFTHYCRSKILVASVALTASSASTHFWKERNFMWQSTACCSAYDQKARRVNSWLGELFGRLIDLLHCDCPGCWDCCCHYGVHRASRRLINGH
jgi:hypothetical protein